LVSHKEQNLVRLQHTRKILQCFLIAYILCYEE